MSARTSVEAISYGNWAHNLRLSNGRFEAVITLDVGPRIIRYAPVGGENALGEMPAEMGTSGEDHWVMRGGHRMWTAPEDPIRTYAPDNGPVRHTVSGTTVQATTPADDRWGLERALSVHLEDDGSKLTVGYTLTNRGSTPIEIAPWAITVMPIGGEALIPLPPVARHPGNQAKTPADFGPRMSLVFWPYFRFDDPRFRWGNRLLRVRQVTNTDSTKIGVFHRPGWAAYLRNHLLFVKRFGYRPEGTKKHGDDARSARYPDMGVNLECYTDGRILELETLAALSTLEPGAEVLHEEIWTLSDGVEAPRETNVATAGQTEAEERSLLELVERVL